MAGHDLVEENVRQTHMEDSTVVSFVCVVTVGQVRTVKASADFAQNERGVGWEAVECGCGVPA